jgi:hypothetical protein
MSNSSVAHSSSSEIGAHPRDPMPDSPDDIIEITDDMLMDVVDGRQPPPRPLLRLSTP